MLEHRVTGTKRKLRLGHVSANTNAPPLLAVTPVPLETTGTAPGATLVPACIEPECHTRGVGLRNSARSWLAHHAPRTRWLLLAAAVAVLLGVAAARANHGAHARHVAHARVVVVHYLSGGLSQMERDQLNTLAPHLVLSHGTIHADLDRARPLVSVTVGGHRHVYYMAPLSHGVGGCFLQIVDRHTVADSECGYDPRSREPAVSEPDVVGAGTALGAETFPVGGRVQVVLGVMPAKRDVVSVRVRFQDGTTDRAPTNGAFFAYVVFGRHVRAGHRPIALVGLTAAGDVAATQPLGPGWFG